MIRRLLFEIILTKEQYREILQIFIEYKMNSIAKFFIYKYIDF